MTLCKLIARQDWVSNFAQYSPSEVVEYLSCWRKVMSAERSPVRTFPVTRLTFWRLWHPGVIGMRAASCGLPGGCVVRGRGIFQPPGLLIKLSSGTKHLLGTVRTGRIVSLLAPGTR
jgi:hypothetical protein